MIGNIPKPLTQSLGVKESISFPFPYQAPNANSYAERWVRTVREECLDYLLILNEAHLQRVLGEYIGYYNVARPHQGIGQQTPIPYQRSKDSGIIQSRKVLGGILNDYYRQPASPSMYFC
jgi:putative transposase